jgi:two-component system sensor kinase FixL
MDSCPEFASVTDSDALFRMAVEAAPNAMVMIDPSGAIVMVNAQTELVFGYDRQEMLGRPIELLLPARFSDSHPARRNGFFTQPKPRPMGAGRDLYARRKSGEEFPVEIGLNPIETSAGIMVLSAIVDITKRKADEQALRESEHRARRLAAIVESSEDAIIGTDLDGVVTSWNRSAERIFGYSEAEMQGQPVFRIAPPGYEAEMRDILRRVGLGERIEHYQTLRRCSDGSILNISLSVSPIYDLTGRLVGVSKVARDVTEATRSETALKDSQSRLQELQAELLHISRLSAMGEMASALAHEVNQPLAAISNYMRGSRRLLAASPDPLARRVEDALDKAAEQAVRAGQIIRRLRGFVARGDAEKRRENFEKLAEDALALGLIGQHERAIAVRREFDGDIYVLVDRVQIQQVLVNLVRNAAESMADCERRELTVCARPAADEMIEVTVSDTGKGLPEHVRENLFRPFFTTKASGMGVGLSISRSIVEAHGGDMTAAASPSGGAAFIFTLPMAPSESPDE